MKLTPYQLISRRLALRHICQLHGEDLTVQQHHTLLEWADDVLPSIAHNIAPEQLAYVDGWLSKYNIDLREPWLIDDIIHWINRNME